MFYVALATSLIMLIASNIAVLCMKKPVRLVAVVCLFVFGLPGAILVSYAGFFLALLLIALAALTVTIERRRLFIPLSLIATVVVFGICGWLAYRPVLEAQREHPYVSLEGRLPTPNESKHCVAFPSKSTPQVIRLETTLDMEGADTREYYQDLTTSQQRTKFLKQLHEDTLSAFVNSPGFGVSRIPATFRGWSPSVREEQTLPQTNVRLSEGWSSTTLTPLSKPLSKYQQRQLTELHFQSLMDFINPIGFGYIKDRKHVAGFRPHQFHKSPQFDHIWKLEMIELVGLVVHKKPVAYVTKNLPKMDELREAPTRPLDKFERLGLKELAKGKELFVRDTTNGRRVLGAIRDAKQCTACHGAKRGDMLGAFSYTLRKQ